MERRLLLAVVLSFIVVFASNYFMTKKMEQGKRQEVTSNKEKEEKEEAASTADDFSTAPAPSMDVKAETETKEAPTVETKDLKDITVKTKLFTAVFTNYGARLKSLKLNDFKVDQSEDSDVIDLITVTKLEHLPLDIHFFTTQNIKSLTGSEVFNVNKDELDLTKDPKDNRLVFSYLTKDGIRVKKILAFAPDRYNIDVSVELTNTTLTDIDGKMNINWIEHFVVNKKDRASTIEAFAFNKNEVIRASKRDLDKKEFLVTDGVKWSGLLRKFFMVAFIPKVEEGTSFYAEGIDKEHFHFRATTGDIILKSGETKLIEQQVYIGPKLSENLKEYGVGLQSAINYGFFSVIAIPLMGLLRFFYRFTHNYGLAIIILTVIIKIIFFPLTQKSYKAMKDMQKISPLLAELKEKYKDDKEKLNREVLALYKKHRVNPVGGCFPIMLQMPVFFALYKILLNAVELRHAPFYFWITDLSSKDPYYITPVIMGVTMLIQQKMSPSSGDKTQQKLMLIMPIVFTFMFANFASGLVIYWLVNNLLSIIQQAFVNKKK